jgi:subtilase family serine protease
MNAIDTTLQEAVALGVTVLAASGDHGADYGVGDGHAHAMFPASDPFITACGGTSIRNVIHSISTTSFAEVVWNDGFGASGGGVSDVFPLPAWQAAAGVPTSLKGTSLQASLQDQANWRWCNKCQGLAFAGSTSLGLCPAGGNHDHTGSGNYVLLQNLHFG